jgi:hypothetical protein
MILTAQRRIAWSPSHFAGIDWKDNPFPDLDAVPEPEAIRFPERILLALVSEDNASIRITGLYLVDVHQVFFWLRVLRGNLV